MNSFYHFHGLGVRSRLSCVLLARLLFVFTSCLPIVNFSYSQDADYLPQKENPGLCEGLAAALDDYNKLKVGMTIHDLLVNFDKQGGIVSDTKRTFRSRRCGKIQIDVECEAGGLLGRNLRPSDNAVITKFSRLYIAEPQFD